MVHVGQNMFNFVFTTLAWFLASQFYSHDSSELSPSPRRLTRFSTRSGITRRGKEYEGFGRWSHDRRPQLTKDREDES